MKKFISVFTIALVAVGLFSSCQAIEDEIQSLKDRITNVEENKIATLSQQVSSIEGTVSDLEQTKSAIENKINKIKSTQDGISESLDKLEQAKSAIEERIEELNALASTLKKETEDWANGTFATLEALEQTSALIAQVKGLTNGIDEKIDKAVNDSREGLKTWINEKFDNYYTIAQIDDMIGNLQTQIDELEAASGADLGKIMDQMDKLEDTVQKAREDLTKNYEEAIKTAIEKLKGELNEELKNQIAAANLRIDELEKTVGTLETTVADLETRMAKAEDDIASINEQIDAINKSIETLLEADKEIDAKIGQYEGAIKDLQDLVDAVQAEQDKLEQKDAELQNLIDGLKETLDGLQAQVDALKKADAELDARIKALEAYSEQIAKIDGLVSDIEDIKKWQETVNKTLEEYQQTAQELAALQTTVAGISANLATAVADIAALKAADTGFNTRLTTLETELSTLKSGLDERITGLIEGSKETIMGWVNTLLQQDYLTKADTEAKIKAVQDQIDAINVALSTQATTIADLKAKGTADAATIAAHETAINDLKKQLEQLKAEETALEAKLKDATDKLEAAYKKAIQDATEALTAEYKSYIDKAIADLDARIPDSEALKAECDQAVADIAALDTRIGTLEATAETLTSDVESIKTDVEDLKTKVNAILENLRNMIQSIVFIPEHIDGYARVDTTDTGELEPLTMNFKVTPAQSATSIDKDCLTAFCNTVATKSGMTDITNKILSEGGIAVNDGILTVKFDLSDYKQQLMAEEPENLLSISICVTKDLSTTGAGIGQNEISSKFISVVKEGYGQQQQSIHYFRLLEDKSEMEVGNKASSVNINLVGDPFVRWEVETTSGVTASPKNGIGSQEIKLSYERNRSYPRNLTVTIKQIEKSVSYEPVKDLENDGRIVFTLKQAGEKTYPRGVIEGYTFSVQNGTKVFLAKGNLYWDGNKWAIEDNQEGFASTWNNKHVSHFFWDSSESAAYQSDEYKPGDSNTNRNLFANTSNYYVEIYDKEWHIMSSDYWNYLLNSRTVNGGKGNGNSWKQVTYNGNTGILIFPDDFTDQASVGSTISAVPEGCAFLPNTGSRQGTTITTGDWRYWTSTVGASTGSSSFIVTTYYYANGKSFWLNNGSLEAQDINKGYGLPVRPYISAQ